MCVIYLYVSSLFKKDRRRELFVGNLGRQIGDKVASIAEFEGGA
jgi:hypothetical protein